MHASNSLFSSVSTHRLSPGSNCPLQVHSAEESATNHIWESLYHTSELCGRDSVSYAPATTGGAILKLGIRGSFPSLFKLPFPKQQGGTVDIDRASYAPTNSHDTSGMKGSHTRSIAPPWKETRRHTLTVITARGKRNPRKKNESEVLRYTWLLVHS